MHEQPEIPQSAPAAPVRGFIDVSTGRPAAHDTEVSLAREGDDGVVRALCRCDATGVSAADRLVITFDPAGCEADALQLSVAPDEALLAEAEELIWPGNPPGLAWKLLIDRQASLTPALAAKLRRDTIRALRRAVPAPRFAWIAHQLLRRMAC